MRKLLIALFILSPLTHFAQYIFTVADPSDSFQAEVVMPDCVHGKCLGRGYVRVSRKGSNTYLQTIHFKNQSLSYPQSLELKEGEPTADAIWLPLQFADINFDSHSDLVLGSFGEPFIFYLYDEEKKVFNLDPLTGKLKRAKTIAVYTDTAQKKLLVRYFQSGREIREEYRWKDGKPQMIFSISVQKRYASSGKHSHLGLGPYATSDAKTFIESYERDWRDYGREQNVTIIVVIKELKESRWETQSKRFTPSEYAQPENARWKL